MGASRWIVLVLAVVATPAVALPDFYRTAASSADFSVYAIYEDHQDPNRYWVPYDMMEVVRDDQGLAKFSVVHWGITAPDIDGTGATLTFTVRPQIDQSKFGGAMQAILARNPGARFSPFPIVDSEYELLIDRRFVYGSTAEIATTLAAATPPDIVIAPIDGTMAVSGASVLSEGPVRDVRLGGAGAGPQAFLMELDRLGGRALANATSMGSEGVVLRYRYKVSGIGPRLHARLTVHWKRLYQELQKDSSATAYFGAINVNLRLAYQRLKESGAITLTILDGGATENDALNAYVDELYQILTKAYISGTGLFAAELKPVAAPDMPRGSAAQAAGWNVSSSMLAQQISEELESTFEIDKQELTDRWFTIGLATGTACQEGSMRFTNLTEGDKPCIPPQSLQDLFARINQCLINAEGYARQLADAGVALDIVEATRRTYSDACLR